jgi:hypothetical protein
MTDGLVARAKERAEGSPVPEEFGYRLVLNEHEHFVGRWRGETIDEANGDRAVYLLWDADDQPCFSRHYAALGREIARVNPQVDYATDHPNPGHSYGVETEPNEAELPDGIPF